ncbi:MAG: type 1 glutamine amidotransferase [Bdellovibrionota bacterium]
MRLHCFQHVPFEGPALIQEWAQSRGFAFTFTRFYEETSLPEPNGLEALVVMGGPMGVYEDAKYPWLKPEVAFIKRAIEEGKKVLGICLGAQLIANALGAKVYPNKRKEVGWFPIEAVPGKHSDLFVGIPIPLTVFHWHGDTFDLPAGAENLFRSESCENQAFLFEKNVLGLQFHLEVSAASLSGMVEALPGDLRPAEAEGEDFAFMQNREQVLKGAAQIPVLKAHLFNILDRFFLL